jgi:hypothetical protein
MNENDYSGDGRWDELYHDILAEVLVVKLNPEDLMFRAPSNQELGSVATPQGRLLAWPNVMHHKVEPFELIDPIRPGHRRCIALYLVDPHYRICSTLNVPPQRHD